MKIRTIKSLFYPSRQVIEFSPEDNLSSSFLLDHISDKQSEI